MPPRDHRRRRAFLPYRVLRSRPRLVSSFAVGAVTGVILGLNSGLPRSTCLIIGWDAMLVLYLVFVLDVVARARGGRDIRAHAAEQDEGRLSILVLTVAAGLASLVVILVELSSTAGRRPWQVVVAAATIVLSWAFVHTMFALHYAHECYSEGRTGGLTFPGAGEPDYWDFIYFAFTIGMTSQVTDVAVTSRSVRRTVTAHGVTSFIFNVGFLALTIGAVAGMI